MEKFTTKERTGDTTHYQGFNQYEYKYRITELEFKMIIKIPAGLEKNYRRYSGILYGEIKVKI